MSFVWWFAEATHWTVGGHVATRYFPSGDIAPVQED
jgi:hypothetical protein